MKEELTLTSTEADWRGESDRLGRVVAQASDILGEENAKRWLQTPNRALGGKRPLELFDTDLGLRQVEEVLGRIQSGLHS